MKGFIFPPRGGSPKRSIHLLLLRPSRQIFEPFLAPTVTPALGHLTAAKSCQNRCDCQSCSAALGTWMAISQLGRCENALVRTDPAGVRRPDEMWLWAPARPMASQPTQRLRPPLLPQCQPLSSALTCRVFMSQPHPAGEEATESLSTSVFLDFFFFFKRNFAGTGWLKFRVLIFFNKRM